MSTKLTDAQILALQRWVFTRQGVRSNWKVKLLDAWERAGEGITDYSPELQQLRNQCGPSWLVKQSAQSIERMGVKAVRE
ncbi:hypothetical protein [Bradyrhizobium sp.]|uniref:hypothetical protein n=1 Tax=Bradyrhizobium sp. TaxID=376 RepID=UPI003C48158A